MRFHTNTQLCKYLTPSMSKTEQQEDVLTLSALLFTTIEINWLAQFIVAYNNPFIYPLFKYILCNLRRAKLRFQSQEPSEIGADSFVSYLLRSRAII